MQMNDMKRLLVYEESSGQSILDSSMRSVSCGFDLILCAYKYAYFYVIDRIC